MVLGRPLNFEESELAGIFLAAAPGVVRLPAPRPPMLSRPDSYSPFTLSWPILLLPNLP